MAHPKTGVMRAEGSYGYDFERRGYARKVRRGNDLAAIVESLDGDVDDEPTR